MLRNLTANLVLNERIETTEAKAKELRRVAERLITKAIRLGEVGLHAPGEALRGRQGQAPRDQAARLGVPSPLGNAREKGGETKKVDIVEKVMLDLAKRFAKRPGGYTRIVKMGPRRGDNAPLVIIEFVDQAEAAEGEARRRRRRRRRPRRRRLRRRPRRPPQRRADRTGRALARFLVRSERRRARARRLLRLSALRRQERPCRTRCSVSATAAKCPFVPLRRASPLRYPCGNASSQIARDRGLVVGRGLLATTVVGACADKKGALMLAITTDIKAPKDVNAGPSRSPPTASSRRASSGASRRRATSCFPARSRSSSRTTRTRQSASA